MELSTPIAYILAVLVEGQLELLPPIRKDGRKSRKLYPVPNKRTKPLKNIGQDPGFKKSATESEYLNIAILEKKQR